MEQTGMSTVWLFQNKAEELQEETWLSEDTDFHLDGINITSFDRDVAKTRKSIGGGLCIAVTNKWATNFTEKLSALHTFKPHYLTPEFSSQPTHQGLTLIQLHST